MAALGLLHGGDGVGVEHRDAYGRFVAHGGSDFAVERFFHITSVEESGKHVTDAVLFKANVQVLVRHVESEGGRDDAHLGLPVFLSLVLR